mgnify:CR=1 FL=1
MASTALQRALAGQNVSESGLKAALRQAANKIENANKKAAKVKDQAKAVGGAILETAEIQGATALVSFGSGYFNEHKKITRWGRGLVGAGAVVYGMVEASDGAGGDHALALGNGVLASLNAELTYQAGFEFAQSRAAKKAAGGAPATQGALGAPVREVAVDLTPAPSAGAGRRFVRAAAL